MYRCYSTFCFSCHSEDEIDDNVEVQICDSNTSYSDFEMKEDIDDDCEYTLTPEKSTFNKSMGELDQNWTPLKYQLGSNFDSCDIKTKQRLVKKAMQAIDNVLYSIALGQVEALKKECFEQNDREKEQIELFRAFLMQFPMHQEEILKSSFFLFFAKKMKLAITCIIKMS